MIVAEMCDSDASVGQNGFVFGIKLQGFCSLEEVSINLRCFRIIEFAGC